MKNRVIETNLMDEDIKIEKSLRPQTLEEYIGQEKAKNNNTTKKNVETKKQNQPEDNSTNNGIGHIKRRY